MTSEGGVVLVLGIDPAPAKNTVVFSVEEGFETWPAAEVKDRLRSRCGGRRTLIAWDAPLSFSRGSYSDRDVDRSARAWLATLPARGRRAANALPFSACPHWAISCDALGLPFPAGDGEVLAKLASSPDALQEDINAIEVHPAVSLAVMWFSKNDSAFPDYKKNPEDLGKIVRGLALEVTSERGWLPDDDHLDAWISWRMGVDFLGGQAGWFGDPVAGGYVLPTARSGRALGLEMRSRRGKCGNNSY